jgi:hypothetical protein
MEVIKKRFYKSLAGFRGDFYLAAFVALTLLPPLNHHCQGVEAGYM